MGLDDAVLETVERRGCSLAVAESLTGGLLSNRFARLEGAASWFRGGVVAYCRPVKEDLLGIGDAPVVSRDAATAMATGVARLLGADVGLALTGVGGPGDEDGVPAGTVWLACHADGSVLAERRVFSGDPGEVVAQTCAQAARLLVLALEGATVAGAVG